MIDPSLRLPDDPDPPLSTAPPARGRAPAGSFPSLIRLAGAVATVAVASWLGQIATMRGIAQWYPALAKPALTPPNWLFPLAWTLLYALMAWSFWRILRYRPQMPGRTTAIALFVAQLALNALWSWAFFAARSPVAGLAVILALLIAIFATIRAFAALDSTAARLLWPYLGWVGFAAWLNGAIVWLNG